ncbi:hypothetical protein ACFVUN_06380 [Kitasatospora griseola]|uniref:hypothetical protein n=1 Tax=Kitasatospora griseola TaxID=2064 RepID=UPI0036D98F09
MRGRPRRASRPAGAANRIKTVPGHGWFAIVRFHGPEEAFFDRRYTPGDFEKLPASGVWPEGCTRARGTGRLPRAGGVSSRSAIPERALHYCPEPKTP